MQQEDEAGDSLDVPTLSGEGGALVLPWSPGVTGSGRGVEVEEDLPSGIAA